MTPGCPRLRTIVNRRNSNWPKAGTSGVIKSVEGYNLSYSDLPMSVQILNDFGAGLPEGPNDPHIYWVRNSLAGMHILGPKFDVIDGSSDNEV